MSLESSRDFLLKSASQFILHRTNQPTQIIQATFFGGSLFIFPETNLLINDVISSSQDPSRYIITGFEPAYSDNQLLYTECKVVHESDKSLQPGSSNTYNIGTVSNSIIGTQSNASLSITNSIPLEEIKLLIASKPSEDQAELSDLLKHLQELIENDKVPRKGFLSKFNETINKHSDLITLIGKLFVDWLTK